MKLYGPDAMLHRHPLNFGHHFIHLCDKILVRMGAIATGGNLFDKRLTLKQRLNLSEIVAANRNVQVVLAPAFSRVLERNNTIPFNFVIGCGT